MSAEDSKVYGYVISCYSMKLWHTSCGSHTLNQKWFIGCPLPSANMSYILMSDDIHFWCSLSWECKECLRVWLVSSPTSLHSKIALNYDFWGGGQINILKSQYCSELFLYQKVLYQKFLFQTVIFLTQKSAEVQLLCQMINIPKSITSRGVSSEWS